MATSTITNTVTDPSGVAVPSFTVVAALMPGPGMRVGTSVEVARTVSTVADASGAWSLTLERQSNIAPSGSWYRIEEQIPESRGGPREWAITVGDSASYTLHASLVTPLPPPALVVPPTQTSGSDRIVGTFAARQALTGMVAGDRCYVTSTGRNYRWTGSEWRPIDFGTHNNVLDFGAIGDALTDDAPAVNTTIDYALNNGGSVFFPGPPPGVANAWYKLGSTITIDFPASRGGQGRRFVHLLGGSGWNTWTPNTGGAIGFGSSPTAKIIGPGAGVVAFKVLTVSVQPTFENLAVYNEGTCLQLGNVGGADETCTVAMPGCSFQSARAGDPAIRVYGAFWVNFGSGDKFTAVHAPDTSTPAIVVHGDNNSMALMRFSNVVLNAGWIQLRYDAASIGPRGHLILLENVTSENLVGRSLLECVATGAGIGRAFDKVTLIHCSNADSTGDCPLVVADNVIVGALVDINSASEQAGGEAYRIKNAGEIRGLLRLGLDSSKQLIYDVSGNVRGDAVVQTWNGWDHIIRTVEGTTAWTARGGHAQRVGRDNEAHARHTVDRDGVHGWGPGGASGGIDTNLYRLQQDELKTDDSLHVGGFLSVAAGSEAAPGVRFAGDTNTGLYHMSDNNIGLVTNGVRRVQFGTSGMVLADGYNVFLGSTTGTKFGTSTTEKLGFYNATPVVQPTAIVDADGTLADITTKFNSLLAKQRTLGLIAT